MGKVLIGTAGWSYEDWKGIVYPPRAGSRFDQLVYLAQWCDTIEINSSFYRIPNRRTIDSWIRRTADLPDFQFSAKLFRGLTHERDESTADDFLSEYVRSIEPLHQAGRLAAILMQFPWSFKFDPENLDWIDRLARKLEPMPLAVEVRHASWLDESYYKYLRSKKISFCNIDQPGYKTNIPPTEMVTAPIAYVRFHGRNYRQWFTENEEASDRYNYLYPSEELAEWAEHIRAMARKAKRVYVYMNNHVGGQGLANGLELKSILIGKPIDAPEQLVLTFPELKRYTGEKISKKKSPKSQTRRRTDDQTGSLF